MRPATLTATQKLLLALSFPATLLFLYLLFKRDEEEEDDNVSIKTSRLRVPNDSVKVVIGLQGVQIDAIQMKTRTRMSFQDDSEINKDKILVISGPAEGVREAESIVRQLLEDHLPVISETIYIPRSAIKTVLGFNRENIRNMSRTSKAKIILNRTEARKKEKQFVEVELRGTSISLLSAKKMIMDLVSKESGDAQKQLEEEKHQLDSYSMCFVTAVEHPGHFWIQKIPCSQDYSVDPLDLLIKEMNEFYNSHFPDENYSFAVGDMVTSKLPYDGNWYRAEVKDVVDGDLVLYFVDFGDTEIISQGNVRTLSTQFLSVPFQALECSLASVEPLACHWSEAATKEFENLTNVGKWQPLKFKIFGQKGDFHKTLLSIDLLDEKSEEDWSIADKLVSKGFAQYHVLDEVNGTQKVLSDDEEKNDTLDKKSIPLLCSHHLKSRSSYEKPQGLYEGICDHLDYYSTTCKTEDLMHQRTPYKDYELNFDIASEFTSAKNNSVLIPSVKLPLLSPATERMDYEVTVQQPESKTMLTSSNISYTSIKEDTSPTMSLNKDKTLPGAMINIYRTYPSIEQLANYSEELTNQEKNFGNENFPTITILLSLQNKCESIAEKEKHCAGENKDAEITNHSNLTIKNLNIENEIVNSKDAGFEVKLSSLMKCQLPKIYDKSESVKKKEIENIDLETCETNVEEKIISEHYPEVLTSVDGEMLPVLSKKISEDLVIAATDSGELAEGVVNKEKSDMKERFSEFDGHGFFAEYNEGLQVLNQLESGIKESHIDELNISTYIPCNDVPLNALLSVENLKAIESTVRQSYPGDSISNQLASLGSQCFYSSGDLLSDDTSNDFFSFKESPNDISDCIVSDDVNSSKNLYEDDLSLLLQLHEAYYQQCSNTVVENSNVGHSLYDPLFCPLPAPCVENHAPLFCSSKSSVFISHYGFGEMNCLQFFSPLCPTVENLKTFVPHAKPSSIILSFDSNFVSQHASRSSSLDSYSHSVNGQSQECSAVGVSSSYGEYFPTSPVMSVDEDVLVTKSQQKEEINAIKVEDSFCSEKSYMKEFYSGLSVRGQFGNLEFACSKGAPSQGERDSIKSRRKRKSNKINSPSHDPPLEAVIEPDHNEQQTVELQRCNIKFSQETTFTSCKVSVEPVCEGCTEIPLECQNFHSLKQISTKVPSSRQKSKKRRSKHLTQEALLKADIDQKQISSLAFDGRNVDQIFSPLVSESKFSKASAEVTGRECDHELDQSEAYFGKRMKSIKKRKKKAEGTWFSSHGPPPPDSGQVGLKDPDVLLQNPQKRVKENKIRSALRKLAQEDPASRNEKLVMVAGETSHRRK